MANIRELILSIESDALTFDEKLAALNQVEETLVAMQQQEEDAIQENVDLIVEAIKVMQEKVDAQVNRIADLVPEKGEKGDKGDRGLDGRDGVNGKDGRDGVNGRDGKDGEDGISVTDAKIDFDGSLVITLSTGREINVGEVVASDLAEKIHHITTMSTNASSGGISSVASADGSVTVTTNNGAVDLSVAVSASTTNVICLVRNATGATLTKGTVVYINGATGQNPTVTKAIATSDSTSAQTLGVMSADLANNSNGYVTIIGLITNINTSAYLDGQQLYLSYTTAGALTATKPYAPNHLVYVAIVEHAHPTQGKLFVKVQNGYELDELHNVSAQFPSNGDTLVYNTSTSLWETTARNLGTVTSVSGTGTVSGLTLSGTVTSSGSLTLGGSITGFATSGANTNLTSVALTSGTVSNAPSSSTDIVNKSYADSIATGVNFHSAVQYATTAALPANTYNNGTSGVGATLTANANGTLAIDGYTLVSGDVGKRLLIKNESTQANNGVYTLTQAGTASLPYILTRATDYDSSGSGTNEVDQGDLILVINGTTNANTSWVEQTPLPITIGTTALVFIQFAAIQTYTAGTGLTLSTNQFSISNVGTAGTYGSASQVPVLTTNAQGQVTGVTNTAIAISGGSVSGNIAGSAGSVANALTAGTGITFSSGTTYNGSSAITINATGGSGTVTSVSGTGTVNGLTLSGTVTSSGNLTLGGTLDLSSPPAIGGTIPAAGTYTTLNLTGTTDQVSSVAVTSVPTAPSAGNLKTFARTIAGGYTAPAFLNATNAVVQLQPAFANKRIGNLFPINNSTPTIVGLNSFTGTVSIVVTTTTSMFTRANRFINASSATAGSLANYYQGTASYTLGSATSPAYGGFYFVMRFGIADTVASPRSFFGLSSTVGAPTNVEPSTLTNSIGVGQGAANTNLFIYYGGSAAQTPIDLGANFPTGTSNTDLYELTLFAPPTSNNTVYYQVIRLNTGNVASGTLTGTAGTALPSNTTYLAIRNWRTNNATASIVNFALAGIYMETDY